MVLSWCDFPLDKDDTWEQIANLTGLENIICEFQKQYYVAINYAVKRQMYFKRCLARGKLNVSKALDNTVDDIQEARGDNRGDDPEEDSENEDEEGHGEDHTASDVQPKWRQERNFYFITEAVKRIHSKEGATVTVMCQVGGHSD